MATPGQLTKLEARAADVKKLYDAYVLVIAEERRAMNGHAAEMFPDKLRAVITEETHAVGFRATLVKPLTREVYRLIAAAPDRTFTLGDVRAQLNGLPHSDQQLSGALARMKMAHYLKGGHGKYRVNPNVIAPYLDVPALPPAPDTTPTRSHHQKVATKKTTTRGAYAKARARGRQNSVLIMHALAKGALTREALVQALRGNKARSTAEASRIANRIGPLVRRGYVRREGDTYVKAREYRAEA